MTVPLRIELEWEDAAGVGAPEVAATWSRITIRVAGRPVTLSSHDGATRDGIYGSAYPLAEWIAYNWWPLRSEVRVSAERESDWSWSRATPSSWHHRHNLRGAGGGMLWPDLAIVPEGAVTRLAWSSTTAAYGERGREFLLSGSHTLASAAVTDELRRVVETTIERLRDRGIRGTPLEAEWDSIRALDPEERRFCDAAARLGFDPFSVDEALAEVLVAAGADQDDDFIRDLFDSVSPSGSAVREAARWIDDVDRTARDRTAPRVSLEEIRSQLEPGRLLDPFQPWKAGFALAQSVRRATAQSSVPFDTRALTEVIEGRGRGGGLAAYSSQVEQHARLAIPDLPYRMSSTSRRFLEARAIGLHLLQPGRRRFLLTDSRTPVQSASRSFAAELLAPADEVATMIRERGGPSQVGVLDSVATELEVSPSVVQHQWENLGRSA